MKILIIGAKGMLGQDLSQLLAQNKHKVIEADINSIDITDLNSTESFITQNQPEIIINCAAYTNVNEAEDTEKELNYKVNAEGVKNIVSASNKVNAVLFHISTDYVFGDNNPDGYDEDDVPNNALNEYGKAKREGEIFAEQNNNKYFVCRTSWLYGANGKNFVDTMIELSKSRDELSIVTDEVGVPTYTVDLSRQISHMINDLENLDSGYFHVVNSGSCSRFEQAQKIFAITGTEIRLNETTLSQFQRKAQVPNVSILKNNKLPALQSWEDAIREYIKK